MGYARSAVSFLEILLGSDNHLSCLRASTHPVTAAAIMDGFLALVVLVGANMLIAMMAKTFDVHHEQQVVNFMYLTSLLCASWARAEAVPPPFAALGLPYLLWTAIVRGCAAASGHKPLEEGEEEEEEEEAPAVTMPKVPELKAKMEAYLEEHDGDQGEEDKYRKQMATQQAHIKSQVGEVKRQQAEAKEQVKEQVAGVKEQMKEQVEQVAGVKEQVAGVKEQVAEVKEQVAKLLSKSGGTDPPPPAEPDAALAAMLEANLAAIKDVAMSLQAEMASVKAEVQRLEGKLNSAGGASTSRSASPRGSSRFSLTKPRE